MTVTPMHPSRPTLSDLRASAEEYARAVAKWRDVTMAALEEKTEAKIRHMKVVAEYHKIEPGTIVRAGRTRYVVHRVKDVFGYGVDKPWLEVYRIGVNERVGVRLTTLYSGDWERE